MAYLPALRTLDFLGRLHDTLAPPTYLEIGVRHGDSLIHSRSPAIGIDPVLKLRHPVPEGAVLFEETSDAFFAREQPLEPFGGRPAHLTLIDGMHLSEYALRDFVNVERRSHWTGVIAVDDVLPRSVEEASRERATTGWTGDVYKLVGFLSAHRPDLVQILVGTSPTGLLLVLGLDPGSGVLDDRFDDLARQADVPDPQRVPLDLLDRRGALEPEWVLSASFWAALRSARDAGASRTEDAGALRRAIEAELRGARRIRYPPRALPRYGRRLRRVASRLRPG